MGGVEYTYSTHVVAREQLVGVVFSFTMRFLGIDFRSSVSITSAFTG